MATQIDNIFKRDFRVMQDGRIQELTGRQNMKSSIENRFSVLRRSVPFRPNYGANLSRYQNEPMTSDLIQEILKEVRSQVLRDSRVAQIRAINLRTETEGIIEVDVEILLIGSRENLALRLVT